MSREEIEAVILANAAHDGWTALDSDYIHDKLFQFLPDAVYDGPDHPGWPEDDAPIIEVHDGWQLKFVWNDLCEDWITFIRKAPDDASQGT